MQFFKSRHNQHALRKYREQLYPGESRQSPNISLASVSERLKDFM